MERNHNNDYFGQYWIHDYSKDYFWVWKHDVFIQHDSPKQHFVTENFEILHKKNPQNGHKENIQMYRYAAVMHFL